ncbi:RDD family protein [Helicobacter canadensis]|uniref:Predicted membrane protein n=1 Tax=Helicobacter canadensis MIT 98-5491 TaxID=537970 RepID=C5ZVE6_9HELI|nr:RDD family protein [Helicobacter canadensis]EES88805.1 predicted membrane protein [Helicobacter canadensis MIT 98-5491]EFR48897.1 RDD family protein [Helicobacter canadensis MIT 98-5491]STP00071.1 RDD protein [Helicobacter canadensis]
MSKRWRNIKKQNISPNISLSLQEDSNYATFWERGKAQVIDTFMIYLPLLYFLTYVVIGSAKEFRESNWGPFVAVLIYGLIVALLMAFKGQTLGKKAYDLWVKRENNQPITFFFALLRFFLFLVSGVTIIGILMPLWRKDRSALHDLLLKTKVYKKG